MAIGVPIADSQSAKVTAPPTHWTFPGLPCASPARAGAAKSAGSIRFSRYASIEVEGLVSTRPGPKVSRHTTVVPSQMAVPIRRSGKVRATMT